MATRKRTSAKKSKQARLEVQVMFEPSRLAQNYLEQAYACLIPSGRRRLKSLLEGKPDNLAVTPKKPAAGGES